MTSEEPKVSFIIPILNEGRNLSESLDSLLSIDYPVDKMEILLAIGRCTDNTRMIAEHYAKKYSNICILENPTGNTAIGRNICIKHSTGEMLMNYSGHVTAEKNILKALALNLQKFPVDIVAVGCSNLSPKKQNFIGEASGYAFLSIMGGRNFFSQNSVFHEERITDHLSFSCYRKEAVEKVGCFDPNFSCGQDYELDIRLRKAGYKIMYTPKTKVYHFKRESIKSLWIQMYNYGVARAKIVKKHPNSLRFFHLLGPGLILIGVLVMLLAIGGMIPVFVIPFLAVSYIFMSLVSALLVTRKPKIVLSSVLFYLIIHAGYGIGFIRGII